MHKLLIAAAAAAAAALLPFPAIAQAPPPPKLLVVISVDQFSANLFDEYRPQFTGGLARLASGTVFDRAYQSHANTETCPGHSTILTGDHPARTGIIGNTWFDQSVPREDKWVYCAEDERTPGSSSTHYKVSPLHLMVPTLGDLMKARWPGSRNVAVSGKNRAAVMMSGHKADQRWYWDGKQFTTDLSGTPIPQVVPKVNSAIAVALAQAQRSGRCERDAIEWVRTDPRAGQHHRWCIQAVDDRGWIEYVQAADAAKRELAIGETQIGATVVRSEFCRSHIVNAPADTSMG